MVSGVSEDGLSEHRFVGDGFAEEVQVSDKSINRLINFINEQINQ